MIATRFTERVGCSVPIQLAAMPGIGAPELVAAVADAGAVGMLSATMVEPAQLSATLAQLTGNPRRVIGVNFLIPFLDRECVAIAARRARIVEFFYGDPDPRLVAEAAAHGALVSWQVGSVAEAVAAQAAGCDFVIAQGTEGGGHLRGRESILSLLPEVLEAVEIPVVAAGGIGSARDLAAILAFGAGGARLGTRFVAARESGAHPVYVRALVAAQSSEDTCVTDVFSQLWPGAPHRVLRSAITAVQRCVQDPIGEIRIGGRAVAVSRYSAIAPTRETTGHIDAMALYAGESVVDVHTVQPAATIIAELVRGAAAILASTGE